MSFVEPNRVPVYFEGYVGPDSTTLEFVVDLDCFEEESPVIAFFDEYQHDYCGMGAKLIGNVLWNGRTCNLYQIDRKEAKDHCVELFSDSIGEFDIIIGHYVNGSIKESYREEFCCK